MHMISLGFVVVIPKGDETLAIDSIYEILDSLGVERAGDIQARELDPRFDVPAVLATHDEEVAFPIGSRYVSYTVPVYPKGQPRVDHVEEQVTALIEAGPGFVQPRKSVTVSDQRLGLRFTTKDLPKDTDI